MSLHADQEEKYTEEFKTANWRCDHHREEIKELKADNAVMWIRLNSMEQRLCHCQDRPGPPISAVGSPEPSSQPTCLESSLEYHTPPIEVISLHSDTPSPEPLLIPDPIIIRDDSPIILSNSENIVHQSCIRSSSPIRSQPVVARMRPGIHPYRRDIFHKLGRPQ